MRKLFLIIAPLILVAAAVFVMRGSVSEIIFSGSPSEKAKSDFAFSPREAPAGQLEYHNQRYRFSLFYPDNLEVKVFDEGGGASTITFQNIKSAEGFQIFIVPYAGTQVSEAQFKKDEPSGVRKSPKDGLVGGVTAATFYSSSVTLGETAEVWFIHGGYLYEVTTLKPLDTWLAIIMHSWLFI